MHKRIFLIFLCIISIQFTNILMADVSTDETIIANSRKLREICDEEKLSKIVGKRNAESMSKKLSADIFVASVVFVNQVKTADGYDFLKHSCLLHKMEV